MKRIPKSFQIMGHTITVRLVSKRDWEDLIDRYEELEDSVAWWIPDDNLIVIQRGPKAQMLHRFYHELMHCIYHFMNSPLNHDEDHVDQAGGLLAQVFSTAK
jgi:GTP1/Obg family GTP-binding protein